MRHRTLAVNDCTQNYGPEWERSTFKVDAMRARIGRQAYDINVGQFCCGGLNFGYFYVGYPIIACDGEAAPAYTIDQFSQSTVPGRTPHLWLHGKYLYDALDSDFTLLRSRSADSSRRQAIGTYRWRSSTSMRPGRRR